MKQITMIIALSSFLFVSACADQGQKQTFGTLGGAALGGLAGSQFGKGHGRLVGVGVGVLLGGLIGSEIGKSLDAQDRASMNQANQRAYSAPVGETINWNNPQSGNHGSYTPVRDGYSTSGRYCREYQQTVTVGGKTQSGYGTACRQPDGSWEIVK